MPRHFSRHDAGGPRIREIPLRLLVPNLITILSICAGLSGVRLAIEHRFELAAIMVLLAAFLDGIDGRVARILKATSRFGAQMDSLADIVNFGVVPGLVLYVYLLDRGGNFGWIVALLYAIACALRLARFNVLLEDEDRPAWQNDYFVGVPAPAGAMLVMLPIYLCFLGLPRNDLVVMISCLFTVVVAMLLVSRLPIYSGKTVASRIRRDMVVPIILLVVLYVLLLFSFTWETMAATALLYAAFVPLSVMAYARRAARETAPAVAESPAGEP